MIRGVYFVFIFLVAAGAYAQQSCIQLLNRAEDLYTEGRLLDIYGLLKNCLETRGAFTEGERIRAYKLLTKVYVFTDNEAASEVELIALLSADPVHELQKEDPNELRVLMAKFRTWPIYRIEVKLGANSSVISRYKRASTFTQEEGEKEYDLISISFHGGVDITRHWKKGIEFGTGFQARRSQYSLTSSLKETSFITSITNSQITFSVPVFTRYNLNYDQREGLMPYVFLGASLDYLFKARYKEASRIGGTAFTVRPEDLNLKRHDQVNEINYSLFGGVGLKIHSKKGNFFFAEVRFDKGLLLYNKPENRYNNSAIYGDLQYVEDDLFLNILSINVGYIRSVFKPKKLIK